MNPETGSSLPPAVTGFLPVAAGAAVLTALWWFVTKFLGKGRDVSPEATHRRFTILGRWEAVSFLLLMGIAVPLKRATGDGTLVRWVGTAHGGLFLVYVAAAFVTMRAIRAGYGWLLLSFVAAVIPFGPLLFEYWERRSSPVASVSDR